MSASNGTNSSPPTLQTMFTTPGLSSGAHTLTVQLVNDGNLSLNAFIVFGSTGTENQNPLSPSNQTQSRTQTTASPSSDVSSSSTQSESTPRNNGGTTVGTVIGASVGAAMFSILITIILFFFFFKLKCNRHRIWHAVEGSASEQTPGRIGSRSLPQSRSRVASLARFSGVVSTDSNHGYDDGTSIQRHAVSRTNFNYSTPPLVLSLRSYRSKPWDRYR